VEDPRSEVDGNGARAQVCGGGRRCEERAGCDEEQDTQRKSIAHATHAEYQTLLKDIVLESEYLGG
jgi:hypothetical protein